MLPRATVDLALAFAGGSGDAERRLLMAFGRVRRTRCAARVEGTRRLLPSPSSGRPDVDVPACDAARSPSCSKENPIQGPDCLANILTQTSKSIRLAADTRRLAKAVDASRTADEVTEHTSAEKAGRSATSTLLANVAGSSAASASKLASKSLRRAASAGSVESGFVAGSSTSAVAETCALGSAAICN